MGAITSSFLTKKQGLGGSSARPFSEHSSFELIETNDGSPSFRCSEWDESGHSREGAVSEIQYYLLEQSGLESMIKKQPSITIWELGFGLGWSWYLLSHTQGSRLRLISFEQNRDLIQWSLEKGLLQYDEQSRPVCLSDKTVVQNFAYKSHQLTLVMGDARQTVDDLQAESSLKNLSYDLYFHDAFSPKTCPDFWTQSWFEKVAFFAKKEAQMITYSSASSVSKAMSAAGWRVQKIPGFASKREALRARLGKHLEEATKRPG